MLSAIRGKTMGGRQNVVSKWGKTMGEEEIAKPPPFCYLLYPPIVLLRFADNILSSPIVLPRFADNIDQILMKETMTK